MQRSRNDLKKNGENLFTYGWLRGLQIQSSLCYIKSSHRANADYNPELNQKAHKFEVTIKLA